MAAALQSYPESPRQPDIQLPVSAPVGTPVYTGRV